MKTKTILLLTTAITAFSSFPDARANTINSGSISGIFSSPVLSGAVIDFDGKTLAGWTGAAGVWSVDNGEIVGKASGLAKNEFLALITA